MSKEKISWKQKEQIIFICEILLFVIGSVLFLVSRVYEYPVQYKKL